jgi:hypothetical protein
MTRSTPNELESAEAAPDAALPTAQTRPTHSAVCPKQESWYSAVRSALVFGKLLARERVMRPLNSSIPLLFLFERTGYVSTLKKKIGIKKKKCVKTTDAMLSRI